MFFITFLCPDILCMADRTHWIASDGKPYPASLLPPEAQPLLASGSRIPDGIFPPPPGQPQQDHFQDNNLGDAHSPFDVSMRGEEVEPEPPQPSVEVPATENFQEDNFEEEIIEGYIKTETWDTTPSQGMVNASEALAYPEERIRYIENNLDAIINTTKRNTFLAVVTLLAILSLFIASIFFYIEGRSSSTTENQNFFNSGVPSDTFSG